MIFNPKGAPPANRNKATVKPLKKTQKANVETKRKVKEIKFEPKSGVACQPQESNTENTKQTERSKNDHRWQLFLPTTTAHLPHILLYIVSKP